MKFKRFVSVLLAVMMVVALVPLSPVEVSAATNNKTSADAVAWAQSKLGSALDHDGVYGAQCVDLIRYYYVYLGNKAVSGNGKDYATNALPNGWTRIKNYSGFVPQPGDIAVWTTGGGGYGHVAIVISGNSSTMSVVEQNWVGKYCSSRSGVSTSGIWGVIRPDFAQSTPTPTANIEACVDSCAGDVASINIRGWAFDRDDYGANVGIHVYIDGDSAHGNCIYNGVAGDSRPDVNDVYGAGNNHGFNITIPTTFSGTHEVYIYALDVNGVYNPLIGKYTINITADTTPPVISDAKITDIDETGYTVTCTVTDNTEVDRVQFPTWTAANSQDDIVTDWMTNPIASGTKNGNTYTFRVKFSDHNNEKVGYRTHIAAYDKYGNESKVYLDTAFGVFFCAFEM